MGQGIRTAVAAVVARKLGVSPERITTVVGDTRVTPQHLTAGSWGTASVVPAAEAAADAMLKALRELDTQDDSKRAPAEILEASGRDCVEVEIQKKGRVSPTRSGIACDPGCPRFQVRSTPTT
jgi:xanthine dehydrogenase YagR molybdenum-binding subunit